MVIGRRNQGRVRPIRAPDVFACPWSRGRTPKGSHDVWLGPKLQHGGSYRVRGAASRNDGVVVESDLGRVGNAGQGHHADPFSLSFIIQEKERLVLNDRTSQRSSKLIIVK